ncbi:MAG: hypothetical protein ACRCWR_07165, partial [Saezia sp.]
MLKKWIALLLGLGILFCWASQAQQNSYYTVENRLTHKEIAQIYDLPYPLPVFNLSRTVEELSQCQTWDIPPIPDQQSQEWYRAATT